MTDHELRRSVEAWRAQRHAALRRPMSWLSLVGLDWLHDGTNVIGSGPEAAVRLARGPALAGEIDLRDGGAYATSAVNGALLHAGEPVHQLPLVADADATDDLPPTTLEVEDLRLRLIRRGNHGERFAIRTWDTTAQSLRAFEGIDHWQVDPAWAVRARFDPSPPGTTIPVPDVLGDTIDTPSPGTLHFDVGGVPCQLTALEGGDHGELWLIFADATNGAETYGAGRFLYTDAPGTGGTVIVDFNRAYNPPCVFSPFATCPLPPAGNRLNVRIEAGERDFHPAN